MVNYDLLQNDLDEIINTLDLAGSLEDVGFTKDQARFVNMLILKALELHDKSALSKSE